MQASPHQVTSQPTEHKLNTQTTGESQLVFSPAVSDFADTARLHDIVTDLLFVLYYLRLYKKVLLGYEVAQGPKSRDYP